MEIESVKDLLDQEVKIGDWVGTVETRYRSMKFGRVCGFTAIGNVQFKQRDKDLYHSCCGKTGRQSRPQFIKITPTKQMEIDYEKQ